MEINEFFIQAWCYGPGAAICPIGFSKIQNEHSSKWNNKLRLGKNILNSYSIIWANYNDLSRGHLKWWFSKGIPPKIPDNFHSCNGKWDSSLCLDNSVSHESSFPIQAISQPNTSIYWCYQWFGADHSCLHFTGYTGNEKLSWCDRAWRVATRWYHTTGNNFLYAIFSWDRGCFEIAGQGYAEPSRCKTWLVMAQTFLARWSLMGYTENLSADNNPPLTCFDTLSSHDVPRGSTHVTIFRSAVWDYSQQERMTHSFLDLAARHWSTLDGVLGTAKLVELFLCFTKEVSRRTCGWHPAFGRTSSILPSSAGVELWEGFAPPLIQVQV